jgi:AraC-like DNA-binding protein/mannose-6-phosphate isomerase-like protein (cupin superfamily)
MNHQQLDQFLRKINYIEELQIITHENINDLDGNELVFEEGSTIPRMREDYFFHQGPIFISKHHRFADMPPHVHSFIELNYIYSGVCDQVINGKVVSLEEGQVCLLDTDVPHSITALGENDILINIIMKKETFSSLFLSRLRNTSIVSNFLLNAVSENQRHDHYILFHSQSNKKLQNIIKNVLCEFFDQKDYSLDIVYYYIPIMFAELMRVYQFDKNFEVTPYSGKTSIIAILNYIKQNYRDCTLTTVAERFNFNANYLSNMIKEQTGKNFLELIQEQRMIHASSLLNKTKKSINEIANDIGYESISFFYRKFKDHFGVTPNQYRKKKITSSMCL